MAADPGQLQDGGESSENQDMLTGLELSGPALVLYRGKRGWKLT